MNGRNTWIISVMGFSYILFLLILRPLQPAGTMVRLSSVFQSAITLFVRFSLDNYQTLKNIGMSTEDLEKN